MVRYTSMADRRLEMVLHQPSYSVIRYIVGSNIVGAVVF